MDTLEPAAALRARHRPGDAPPVRLELWLVGVDRPVFLDLRPAWERACVRRVVELAEARRYDGLALKVQRDFAQLGPVAGEDRLARIETGHVRDIIFDRGTVLWCWSKVQSDGRSEWAIMRRRESGYDAAYAAFGQVADDGMDVIDALPLTPTAGAPKHTPTFIERLRLAG